MDIWQYFCMVQPLSLKPTAPACTTASEIKLKIPFGLIFQVAAAREGSDIRIISEPPDSQSGGSAVFLVETGESRTPRPEEATQSMLQA